MNLIGVSARSVSYYRRSHALVMLGISIAAAILCGSLIIGDSVRIGLDAIARARIGGIDGIISGGDRLYRAGLAARLQDALADSVHAALVAPVLQLPGVAANPERAGRTGGVQVLGVDERFWAFAPHPGHGALEDGVVINAELAATLALARGDYLVLRVEKPGLLPRDAPQAEGDDDLVALRLRVDEVVGDDGFARYSLQSGQAPPLNAWIRLATLQAKVGMPGACSLFLLHGEPGRGSLSDAVSQALARIWRPADADIEVRTLPGPVVEVRSRRVFLDAALPPALPGAIGILSYFVNDLQVADRHTPYSLVAAGDWANLAGAPPELKTLTGGDGMVLNSWTADDLGAKVVDRLQLRFSVLGPHGSLSENAATFTITGVVPIAGLAADRELMPAFPGIAEAANCKEWKPGMAIDLKRIRDKDEEYWKVHRGTPKAFISLATGQRLWSNRFGDLTALRLDGSRHTQAEMESAITRQVVPAQVGLAFVPLRERMLAASAGALDFGQLFLSLGFFLIVAALVLAGLLMSLALSTRRRELGLLLALGFTTRQVRQLILGEIALAAVIGSAIGSAIGVLYARIVLAELAGGWSAAVGGGAFSLHASASSIAIGFAATAGCAAATLWWSTRRSFRQPVPLLLADAPEAELPTRRSRIPIIVAVLAGAGAVAAIITRPAAGAEASESFFLIGTSLLILVLALLAVGAGRQFAVSSLARLALANATRRRSRSLAVVMILAAAIFLVVAVGAFRRTGLDAGNARSSGTGGFALVAESTVPIAGDLNLPETQRKAGLDLHSFGAVALVALRTDDGDDASCLNLNHTALPRLFGVDPAALSGRFTVAQSLPGLGASPWEGLADHGPGPVPAIADQATAEWSLGKGVGDIVTYQDEQGQPFPVRIIATLDHSLLQGGLIISEQAFTHAFPARGGATLFLIDAPTASAPALSQALATAFSDHNLRVQSSRERLDSYLAVERTYLDIFQALGVCALLLGSAGVGVVLMHAASERRGELGMLRAVGFTRPAVARLLLGEHLVLFTSALIGGIASGLVAVYPQLSVGGGGSRLLLVGLVLALVVSGVLWMSVGTWWALRGVLITAVRSE